MHGGPRPNARADPYFARASAHLAPCVSVSTNLADTAPVIPKFTFRPPQSYLSHFHITLHYVRSTSHWHATGVDFVLFSATHVSCVLYCT